VTPATAGPALASCRGGQGTEGGINHWPCLNSVCGSAFLTCLILSGWYTLLLLSLSKKKITVRQRDEKGELLPEGTRGWKLFSNALLGDWWDSNTTGCFLWLQSQGMSYSTGVGFFSFFFESD